MKAIMYSRKPKECANILNLIQSLIVSKTCPKDWKDYLSGKTKVKPEPRTVFLYCTKEGIELYRTPYGIMPEGFGHPKYHKWTNRLNGKVVAKFTLNNVEEIYSYQIDGYGSPHEYATVTLLEDKLLKKCCLSADELFEYLDEDNKTGYAIHISNLEIFDKPKELSEFKQLVRCPKNLCETCIKGQCKYLKSLTRAPQNYCYIEIEYNS